MQKNGYVIFFRAWIKKIGRGTIKMIDDCIDKGYPESKYKVVLAKRLLLPPPGEVTKNLKENKN